MIKRTVFFGNPAVLRMKDRQLTLEYPEGEVPEQARFQPWMQGKVQIPVEDIGVLVLDHPRIMLSHGLLAALLDQQAAVITCSENRMPNGLLLPLEGHTLQSERFQEQIQATDTLRKNLWAQTIQAKIENQADTLRLRGRPWEPLRRWARDVKPGDPDNLEARAAAFYWKHFFPEEWRFFRDRTGPPPNALFNYGYAILRACVARALVSSGLLPTLGIHHKNRFNAYCLADDIMEPYRPLADAWIGKVVDTGEDFTELTTALKREMLKIPALDVWFGRKNSPLMVAVSTTTASLARCFGGESRKILYPACDPTIE